MGKKRKPIHKAIREAFGVPDDISDKEFMSVWKEQAKRVCKPCWELKYCPYGPLVEQSPLLPITLAEAKRHIKHLEKCVKTGVMGTQARLTAEELSTCKEYVAQFDPEDFKADPTGELTMMQAFGRFAEMKPTRANATKYFELAKRAIETGVAGIAKKLTDQQRQMFASEIEEFAGEAYPERIPKTFVEMQCRIFRHICPVVGNAEIFTETPELRRSGRYIPFTTKIRVARRDHSTCQECGEPLLDHELEFDHIIPVSRGGSSEEHNIRLTCLKCNRSKSTNVTL